MERDLRLILAIQALCAIAIIVYFQKHKDLSSNPLVVIVCPIIAILGQVYAIYLLFKNIHVLAGTITLIVSMFLFLGGAVGTFHFVKDKRAKEHAQADVDKIPVAAVGRP